MRNDDVGLRGTFGSTDEQNQSQIGQSHGRSWIHLSLVKTARCSSKWASERGLKWFCNFHGCRCQTGCWSKCFKVLICWDFRDITIMSRVYRGWSQKEEISSELQLCGGGCLVNVRTLDWLDGATVGVMSAQQLILYRTSQLMYLP